MKDRRTVDELSIDELEQILRIRKREARAERLRHLAETGRRPPASEALDTDHETGLDTPGGPGIEYESFLQNDPHEGRPRSLRDRLLLGIEVAAVIGLVALIGAAAMTIRDINRASAAEQAQAVASLPTPEPTPVLTTVVLPGGHTPPTMPGGAQPNLDEVPAYLRPVVEQQFAGPVIVPTPGPTAPLRIRVPALSVDAPIVQGDGWEQLKKGVGQHIGSANPGSTGNVVLSAHNDIFGEIFRHLDQLEVGDEITIETQTRTYTYVVNTTRIVEPTEVSVLEQTREALVTLISCYPYLDNSQRIVVIGTLVE